jgi:flavin reductase
MAVQFGAGVDPQDYKRGMRRFASGVTIVTTRYRNEMVGLASTSVSSVSAEPPVLLVCVNRTTSSHGAIVSARSFCVNILRGGDDELASRFGRSENRSTRFEGRDWRALVTGAPALVGCLASFDCKVVKELSADSHTVFFGRVVAMQTWSDDVDPLLYWDGAYKASAAVKAPVPPG